MKKAEHLKTPSKRLLLPVFCALVCLSAILTAMVVADSRGNFTFIGATRCKKCHDSEALGNQYGIWAASPHAKAVLVLETGPGQEIAQAAGVADPAKNVACLKCHTTGGGKTEALLDEGVSCEACHGPGSSYVEPSIHVDFLDRKSAYCRAIQNGMYPVLGIIDEHLKKREKMCLRCHNEERPCLPRETADRVKQSISIQVVDKLIKGDVNFSHRLRR